MLPGRNLCWNRGRRRGRGFRPREGGARGAGMAWPRGMATGHGRGRVSARIGWNMGDSPREARSFPLPLPQVPPGRGRGLPLRHPGRRNPLRNRGEKIPIPAIPAHHSPLEGESARRGRTPEVAPVGGAAKAPLTPHRPGQPQGPPSPHRGSRRLAAWLPRLPLKGGVMGRVGRRAAARVYRCPPRPRSALKEREARALYAGFPPLFKPGAGSAREWRIFAVPVGSSSHGSGFSEFLHSLFHMHHSPLM